MTSTLLNQSVINQIRGTFVVNQNVTLSLSNHVLTVTSNQNTSTPGVRLVRTFNIPKDTIYEFSVTGRVLGGATAYLWGDYYDDPTRRITAQSASDTTYLPSTLGTVSVVIGGFTEDTKIRLGVLFESPPSVNDQFQITAVSLIQRKGLSLGNFRLYELSSNLKTDSLLGSEWKQLVSHTKRSS